MPVRRLPSNPNLEHLKYQARDLRKGHSARNLEIAQVIREFHPRFASAGDSDIFNATLSLNDAQLSIARQHGFASWATLKRHIEKTGRSDQSHLPHHERIEDSTFRRAVELLDAGNTTGLQALLKLHPKLVHQRVLFEGENYFRSAALLEFVAENPVRHGILPRNIVEVARVILEAGADRAARNATLQLVATGKVSRECEAQIPLIDLLCEHGADPGGAIRSAAAHGEHVSVEALIRWGAAVDLPVAAALGRMTEFSRLLVTASPEERHLALALAAQFGHAEIVRLLLEAGENPDTYNPPGGHSHSTPLHQAAAAGHMAVVTLLVERGARLDMKDVLWHGTPAEWARHEGKGEVEEYLRAKGRLGPSE
jgi:hypothetical protein